jgi:hypothetical protein
MQFMILFTLHPDKAETPVSAELKKSFRKYVASIRTTWFDKSGFAAM